MSADATLPHEPAGSPAAHDESRAAVPAGDRARATQGASAGTSGDGAAPGYYGRPVIKPPVWTWEIPLYFFVGGIAGTSAIIALAALLIEKQPLAPQTLASTAAWIACAGAILSSGLLIRDLGRPQRFLNMLRVFKRQSPMSMGAWVLVAFGALATVLAIHVEWPQRSLLWVGIPFDYAHEVQVGLAAATAVFGSVMATYTGVLLGATVIPAWHSHHRILPVHFGVAGLGSSAALLELLGFMTPAMDAIGIGAAAVETLLGAVIELHRHGDADRSVRRSYSGWLLRAAGVLVGPVSLGLRLAGLRQYAAVSFLTGALVSRFGWIEAGRVSAKDPRAVLGS